MTKTPTFYQIAIDGPVAAGKGTAAKKLALRLDYLYVDTGAMYRAATLHFLEQKLAITPENQEQLAAALQAADLDLHNVKDEAGNFYTRVKLNGRDVSTRIRQQDVDLHVSPASALPRVRELLVHKQRHLGRKHSVVMEGRDIGTNVLPDATLKVFLTASLEVRARRRFEQSVLLDPTLTLEQIRRQIEERDYNDTHRRHDPLTIAPDAVVFDTSGMTIDETVDKLLALVRARIAGESDNG